MSVRDGNGGSLMHKKKEHKHDYVMVGTDEAGREIWRCYCGASFKGV
jgi:hypothetical protein